jgi:uncharacterized membrane protein YidH (DUF202 family)
MSRPAESAHLALLRYMAGSSAVRTLLSAERSAMNSERTLAAAIHTGLAVMVLGLAVDRYQLAARWFPGRSLTGWEGTALILLGALVPLVGALPFVAGMAGWRREGKRRSYSGDFLAPLFAVVVSACGGLLLAVLLHGA